MRSELTEAEIGVIKAEIKRNLNGILNDVKDLPISRYCAYTFESLLGEGTYGRVYSAKKHNSTDIFVLKTFKNNSREYMFSAIRELCFLYTLKHKNIVTLREICCKIEPSGNFNFGLVLEACVCSLEVLTENQIKIRFAHKKSIIQQIFQGLSFIHCKSVLHRDLKPGNILISPNGVIKIADFGLAQLYETKFHFYSPNIITPGYKPPETICWAMFYDEKIDIFSIGVVIAELFIKESLFKGRRTEEQAKEITRLLGKFDNSSCPGCEHLRYYNRYFSDQKDEPPELIPYLEKKCVPKDAIQLIARLLQLNPANRPKALEVLEDSFFSSDPTPNGNFLHLIPKNKRLIKED